MTASLIVFWVTSGVSADRSFSEICGFLDSGVRWWTLLIKLASYAVHDLHLYPSGQPVLTRGVAYRRFVTSCGVPEERKGYLPRSYGTRRVVGEIQWKDSPVVIHIPALFLTLTSTEMT